MVSPRRDSGVAVVLTIIQICCAAAYADNSLITLPPVEPIAQLNAGTASKAWHLLYKVKIELGVAGHCETTATICDYFNGGLISLPVGGSKDFTFEADLKPGTYYLEVIPTDSKEQNYWPSHRRPIFIDRFGRLYLPHEWDITPGVFELAARMKGFSPMRDLVAAEQPPLLKWDVVPGATHYKGYYLAGGPANWFNVDEPQYRIGPGVAAGDMCVWSMKALNDQGKVLAVGEGTFFGQGTGALKKKLSGGYPETPTDAQMATMRGPAPKHYQLGVIPFSAQVSKDPKKANEYSEGGGGTIGQTGDFLPGIQVQCVFADSPALDADLHPDDVIIAIDGRPVAAELMYPMGDARAFTEQIGAMQQGRQIALTVRRFPQELILHATIGGSNGATTPATTAPAKSENTVAKDEPAQNNLPVWSDVPGGSPTTKAFSIVPGADTTRLTSGDGLAGNVSRMVELRNGGIAFGTDAGLGIWDGRQVRTFTGPHSDSASRQMLGGNSPLPHNEVIDLLLDSRNRLWVATMDGVCRIDLTKDGPWRVLKTGASGIFKGTPFGEGFLVHRMIEMSDGTVVLSATNPSIIFIDPKTDALRVIQRDDDKSHSINGILEDSQHRLWFAVAGVGLLRYEQGQLQKVPGSENLNTENSLLDICTDSAGTVWVSGLESLRGLHLDGTIETVDGAALPGKYIGQMFSDRDGRLWVSTNGGIAVHAAKPKGDARPWMYLPQEKSFTADSMLLTSDGALWTGSANVTRHAHWSLSAANPRTAAIDQFKRDIEKSYPNFDSKLMAAKNAAGDVIGLVGETILRFDGKKWEDVGGNLGPLDATSVLADAKGTVWVATSGQGLIGIGASGVSRQNNDPTNGKAVIYCLANAPDGTMYAGTQRGLYRLNGANWEELKTDQMVWQVTDVVPDRRSRVWMFEITYKNVFMFDGKRFHDMKDQTPMARENLENLRMDDAGNILIDIPPQPDGKLARRTYRWDATVEGKVGPPVEVH